MRRWRWLPVALAAALVGVVTIAQRPRGGISSVSGQAITPVSIVTNDLTVNGDAGVTKNVNVVGTLIAGVVDAGTIVGGVGAFSGTLAVTGQSALAGVTASTAKADVVDGGTVQAGALGVTGKATVATLAITTDIYTGTLDVTGGATPTVRAGAKCFCKDATTGLDLVCTLASTTLTISGGSNADAYYALCPTTS